MALDADKLRSLIAWCRETAKDVARSSSDDLQAVGDELFHELVARLTEADLGARVAYMKHVRWSDSQQIIKHLSNWADNLEGELQVLLHSACEPINAQFASSAIPAPSRLTGRAGKELLSRLADELADHVSVAENMERLRAAALRGLQERQQRREECEKRQKERRQLLVDRGQIETHGWPDFDDADLRESLRAVRLKTDELKKAAIKAGKVILHDDLTFDLEVPAELASEVSLLEGHDAQMQIDKWLLDVLTNHPERVRKAAWAYEAARFRESEAYETRPKLGKGKRRFTRQFWVALPLELNEANDPEVHSLFPDPPQMASGDECCVLATAIHDALAKGVEQLIAPYRESEVWKKTPRGEMRQWWEFELLVHSLNEYEDGSGAALGGSQKIAVGRMVRRAIKATMFDRPKVVRGGEVGVPGDVARAGSPPLPEAVRRQAIQEASDHETVQDPREVSGQPSGSSETQIEELAAADDPNEPSGFDESKALAELPEECQKAYIAYSSVASKSGQRIPYKKAYNVLCKGEVSRSLPDDDQPLDSQVPEYSVWLSDLKSALIHIDDAELSHVRTKVPDLDTDSGVWVTQEVASRLDGVKIGALRTMRNRPVGKSNIDGTFGVDKARRIWRKDPESPKTVWYLRATLRRPQVSADNRGQVEPPTS